LLKIPGLLLFCGFLIATYALFRRRLGRTQCLALLFLFAFNPALLSYHNQIVSDIPFLFFSTLALLLIDRQIVSRSETANPGMLAVVGVCCAAAMSIRTNGVLLLGVTAWSQLVVLLMLHRQGRLELRKRWPAIVLPYATFLLLIGSLWFALPAGETSHLLFLSRLNPRLILANIDYYAFVLRHFFDGCRHTEFAYGLFFPFFILGIAANVRKDHHFVAYLLFTLLLYVVWPERQGSRFALPIMPLYAYFTFRGAAVFHAALREGYRRFASRASGLAYLCVAALFLFNAVIDFGDGRVEDGPFDRLSNDLFTYISNNTEPRSAIVFFKPRVMFLMTGRRSIALDRPALLAKGDYLVTHKYTLEHAGMQVGAANVPGTARLVYENDRFTVHRLVSRT
jgi:4-amino-4-deoxy-L-arabinose transferase-like glycosyltransferase